MTNVDVLGGFYLDFVINSTTERYPLKMVNHVFENEDCAYTLKPYEI